MYLFSSHFLFFFALFSIYILVNLHFKINHTPTVSLLEATKHSVTFQTPPLIQQCNGNAIFIDDVPPTVATHINHPHAHPTSMGMVPLKIGPKPPIRTSSSPSPSIDSTPSPIPPLPLHIDTSGHMMATLDVRSSPNHRRHPLPPKLSQVLPKAAMDEMRV